MIQMHMPTLLKVSDLNPSAYNPRKITPEKFEALKESIRTDGFIEPIVVQKKGINIIGGHQRVRAIKELCVEESEEVPPIPCIVLDIDDRKAKRLNIKLNKIQGEFEAHLLGELLVDIYDEGALPEDDVSLLGFELDEVEKYVRLIDPDLVPLHAEEKEDLDGFGKSITLSVEFTTVALRDQVKRHLKQASIEENKKSGDLIAGLLKMPTVQKKQRKSK